VVARRLTVSRPRRENRGPNGTLTLRRSSTTPHGSSTSQTNQMDPMPTSDTTFAQSQQYPEHGNASTVENRYSKNKLLDIYKNQQALDELSGDISRLFVNNWEPGHSNGTNGRGWGKGIDSRDHNNGPDICWDQNGQVQPIGLEEITLEEREVSVKRSILCLVISG
jgi:PERQ amino acid-rich with GYF domain-containing protein